MGHITIIGGGLAGSEAAYQIAKKGIDVKLYEMKPKNYSPAHKNENLAEVVCSNSLKSNLISSACGLLKQELRLLDSLLIRLADETAVPAGQALAVDRDKFAEKVTKTLKQISSNNGFGKIEIIREEVISVKEMVENGIVIIATGPLTSDKLAAEIKTITGEKELYFFDAAAPIIEKDSINFDIAFWGDRYGKGDSNYINLPMSEIEYKTFYNELVNAQIAELHSFEKREIFEGCMPVEIMAKRGEDTLRFGPLKPVGFTDPRTGNRPYALVQLRQDNEEGTLFNMVGFQTNLKFGEQKRVFSLIPGLENAEFVKYGVMHRNTYINGSKLLDSTFNFKQNKNLYFAGQISGVEGYVESIMSGLIAAINASEQFVNKDFQKMTFTNQTMTGAICNYISTTNDKFQPMNANFGIMKQLDVKIKDKKEKHTKLAEQSLEKIEDYKKNNKKTCIL